MSGINGASPDARRLFFDGASRLPAGTSQAQGSRIIFLVGLWAPLKKTTRRRACGLAPLIPLMGRALPREAGTTPSIRKNNFC
eukprot:1181493-Pyramimonas_sp.AAC.1